MPPAKRSRGIPSTDDIKAQQAKINEKVNEHYSKKISDALMYKPFISGVVVDISKIGIVDEDEETDIITISTDNFTLDISFDNNSEERRSVNVSIQTEEKTVWWYPTCGTMSNTTDVIKTLVFVGWVRVASILKHVRAAIEDLHANDDVIPTPEFTKLYIYTEQLAQLPRMDISGTWWFRGKPTTVKF